MAQHSVNLKLSKTYIKHLQCDDPADKNKLVMHRTLRSSFSSSSLSISSSKAWSCCVTAPASAASAAGSGSPTAASSALMFSASLCIFGTASCVSLFRGWCSITSACEHPPPPPPRCFKPRPQPRDAPVYAAGGRPLFPGSFAGRGARCSGVGGSGGRRALGAAPSSGGGRARSGAASRFWMNVLGPPRQHPPCLV